MSELASSLIAEAEADLASRLQIIEAHVGLIEEAETLAATLRHQGADAYAHGYTSPAYFNRPAKCSIWVTVDVGDADALLTALGAAELRIADIQTEEYQSKLILEGLAVPLSVPPAMGKALLQRLINTMAPIADKLAEVVA
jgi:hypothetical protein